MHAAVHVQHGVLSAPTLRASHKIGRYPLAERGPPSAELVRLVSEESSMYRARRQRSVIRRTALRRVYTILLRSSFASLG